MRTLISKLHLSDYSYFQRYFGKLGILGAGANLFFYILNIQLNMNDSLT